MVTAVRLAFAIGALVTAEAFSPPVRALRVVVTMQRVSHVQATDAPEAVTDDDDSVLMVPTEASLRAMAVAEDEQVDNRVEGLDFGDVTKNPLTDWNPNAKAVDPANIERSVALRQAFFAESAKPKAVSESAADDDEPASAGVVAIVAALLLVVAASTISPGSPPGLGM